MYSDGNVRRERTVPGRLSHTNPEAIDDDDVAVDDQMGHAEPRAGCVDVLDATGYTLHVLSLVCKRHFCVVCG